MLHGHSLFRLHWEFCCCAKEADVGAHWRKEAGKVVACGKEVGTAGPCGNAACLGTTFGDKAAWGAPWWKMEKTCLFLMEGTFNWLSAPCEKDFWGFYCFHFLFCWEQAGMGAPCRNLMVLLSPLSSLWVNNRNRCFLWVPGCLGQKGLMKHLLPSLSSWRLHFPLFGRVGKDAPCTKEAWDFSCLIVMMDGALMMPKLCKIACIACMQQTLSRSVKSCESKREWKDEWSKPRRAWNLVVGSCINGTIFI